MTDAPQRGDAPLARARWPHPAEPSDQGQQHLGQAPAVAHHGVCAVGRDGYAAERRLPVFQPRFPCYYYALGNVYSLDVFEDSQEVARGLAAQAESGLKEAIAEQIVS